MRVLEVVKSLGKNFNEFIIWASLQLVKILEGTLGGDILHFTSTRTAKGASELLAGVRA